MKRPKLFVNEIQCKRRLNDKIDSTMRMTFSGKNCRPCQRLHQPCMIIVKIEVIIIFILIVIRTA